MNLSKSKLIIFKYFRKYLKNTNLGNKISIYIRKEDKIPITKNPQKRTRNSMPPKVGKEFGMNIKIGESKNYYMETVQTLKLCPKLNYRNVSKQLSKSCSKSISHDYKILQTVPNINYIITDHNKEEEYNKRQISKNLYEPIKKTIRRNFEIAINNHNKDKNKSIVKGRSNETSPKYYFSKLLYPANNFSNIKLNTRPKQFSIVTCNKDKENNQSDEIKIYNKTLKRSQEKTYKNLFPLFKPNTIRKEFVNPNKKENKSRSNLKISNEKDFANMTHFKKEDNENHLLANSSIKSKVITRIPNRKVVSNNNLKVSTYKFKINRTVDDSSVIKNLKNYKKMFENINLNFLANEEENISKKVSSALNSFR